MNRVDRLSASSPGMQARAGRHRDHAPCAACVAELFDPFSPRYRYPFIACNECGPIVADGGAHCEACGDMCLRHDPDAPTGRRATRCYRCGPKLELLRLDGRPFSIEAYGMLDDADAAVTLLQRGQVLAFQGPGGWELLCDARSETALARLRTHAGARPFMLLARDPAMARDWAVLDHDAAGLLQSPEAPVAILPRHPHGVLLPAWHATDGDDFHLRVALPACPVHHLLFRRMGRPLACLEVPMVGGVADAREQLREVAEFMLSHGAGDAAPQMRSVRHAGSGIDQRARRTRDAPGDEIRSATAGHAADALAHHHALLVACLEEHGVAAHEAPLLAAVFDAPYTDREGVWGGEFLRADDRHVERLAMLKPVTVPDASPVGVAWGHLMAEMGWAQFRMNFDALPLAQLLAPYAAQAANPAPGMTRNDCAGLFQAVAVVLGHCRAARCPPMDAVFVLEALADPATIADPDATLDYPFAVPRLRGSGLPYVEPLAMWNALLGDCILDTPPAVMAARFLRGFAAVLVRMLDRLARGDASAPCAGARIALCGEVFANRCLLQRAREGLEALGYTVLCPPSPATAADGRVRQRPHVQVENGPPVAGAPETHGARADAVGAGMEN